MNKQRLIRVLALGLLCGFSALVGYASAHHQQWLLLRACREYLVELRSTKAVTKYFCDRCVYLAPQAACLSPEAVTGTDARLIRLAPGVVCDLRMIVNLGGACRSAATLGLVMLALAGGLRWGATAAGRLGFVGGEAEASISPRAAARRGLRQAIAVAAMGAVAGALAWYINYERFPSVTTRPMSDAFIPDWLGVATTSLLTFAAALVGGGVRRVIRTVASHPSRSSDHRGLCLNCRYPLEGISGSVCPECGTPVSIRPISVMLRRLRESVAVRMLGLLAIVAVGTASILLAAMDDDERRQVSALPGHWLRMSGRLSGAVGRGGSWAFIPLRPDRPISATIEGTEVVLWYTFVRQDRIRFIVATRLGNSQGVKPREDISGWVVRSGEYPRPGPQFEVLVDEAGLLLLSDWSQAFLGPHGTYNPVHVRRGLVESVRPLDALLDEALLAELRPILDVADE
ncbi:MAG: hypothetical protein ACK4WH_07715 [Phycisphaerales bacterium]